MEVMVWDKQLNDDEMKAVIKYLNEKLEYGTAGVPALVISRRKLVRV